MFLRNKLIAIRDGKHAKEEKALIESKGGPTWSQQESLQEGDIWGIAKDKKEPVIQGAFQMVGTACAKALGRQCVSPVGETGRKPMWLKQRSPEAGEVSPRWGT